MSRKTIPLLFTIAVVLTTSEAPLYASIIRVGSGGDFSDLQPAIDAAVDGDIILVEPGTYNQFHLDKGVVICSAAPGQRFNVQVNEATPYVLVENTVTAQKAAITGMNLLGVQTSLGNEVFMSLNNCQGEVILEDVVVIENWYGARNRRLVIQSCANVALVDLELITSIVYTTPENEGVVQIIASKVRMSGSLVQAAAGFNQAAGIEIHDSRLILSSSNVFGGYAEPCSYGPVSNGGDGIIASNSQVMAIGEATTLIEGGDGSSSMECGGPSGDGGAGFRGDSAIVSLVTVKGGEGGYGGFGGQNGNDGPDWDGDLTRDDVIPYLTMTGDLQPGDSVDVTVRAIEAGVAALALGSESGFLIDKSKIGPPLSVLPGGLFVVLALGKIADDSTRVVTCALPDDRQLVGFRLNVQGAVVSATTIYLTNAVSRIVGE